MAFEAGMMVNDEVRLASPLSGSGDAWLADQLDWKKKVVVRFLPSLTKKDDDALEGFLSAAAQAQELESQRVCRLYDFGVSDDFVPFAIMEHVRGDSLEAQLRKDDHMAVKAVGEIVSQIAEVLTEAHAAGLLHLGLSPESVFVNDTAGGLEVKVMDLGIACVLPVDRQSPYVSPERYMGRAAGETSDLWSLGALAYFILTGQHAVDAGKRRMMQWEFEPPSEMWLSDVPPEVDAWFEKALNKLPNMRFTSATEMATAFAAIIPGLEHLGSRASSGGPLLSHDIVAVGTPSEPEETSSDVVVQEATDDAPAIVIDMDD
jgi:serine/threonine-protein kinase